MLLRSSLHVWGLYSLSSRTEREKEGEKEEEEEEKEKEDEEEEEEEEEGAKQLSIPPHVLIYY